MATATTLEERVATLEAEVAALKEKRNLSNMHNVTGRTAPDFLEKYVGIFAGDEMAERVFERVEAEREREREEARNAPDEKEL